MDLDPPGLLGLLPTWRRSFLLCRGVLGAEEYLLMVDGAGEAMVPPYDLRCTCCGCWELVSLDLDRLVARGRVSVFLDMGDIWLDGLGLRLEVGLLLLRRAPICPCHILMSDERRGPTRPVLPDHPEEPGDCGVLEGLNDSNESGVRMLS